ncbi:MAG: long-chain acyl-CoA synthetase [Gaiellaceae bacterium]|nr:long-chain acyl-CoA synthetase [Gaiellaceae bacterium]
MLSSQGADLALVDVDGSELSYSEWFRDAGRLHQQLEDIPPGGTVLILLPETAASRFLIAYVALEALGAAIVPLSRQASESDITRLAAETRATAAIGYVSDIYSLSDAVGASARVTELGLLDLAMVHFSNTHERTLPRQTVGGITVCSSGTTGIPRPTHVSAADVRAWGTDLQPEGRSPFLTQFAIDSLGGLIGLMSVFFRWPIIRSRPLDGAGFANAVNRFAPVDLAIVPAAIPVLERVQDRVSATAQASARRVLVSGAPTRSSEFRVLRSLFPSASLINIYTTSEARHARTGVIYRPGDSIPDQHEATGHVFVGWPLDKTEVRITDQSGEALGPNAEGRVWLRWRPMDDTGEHRVETEWIQSGDLGFLDATGALYLAGRDSDLLDIGGKTVSAQRIELVACEDPNVAEAAAVAIPGALGAARIVVALVARANCDPGNVAALIKARLGTLHTPSEVLVMDSLPRNSNGKVDKSLLKKMVLSH